MIIKFCQDCYKQESTGVIINYYSILEKYERIVVKALCQSCIAKYRKENVYTKEGYYL